MDLAVDGKVALVTGASQGIGKAVAAGLARAGGHVAMIARTPEPLAEAAEEVRGQAGGTAHVLPVRADVRLPGDLRALHETVEARLGPVGILVNNAGTSQRGPFLEQEDDRWQDDLDLKLMAAVRLSRLVIPGMQAAGGGRIINMSALAGKHPGAESAPTSVSRAAGIALTKALSKEFGPHGILVNAVCIGAIESAQQERRWRSTAPDLSLAEFYRSLAAARSVPLGRIGRGDEAANLVVFLASEAASYISGTAINLDGGASHAV